METGCCSTCPCFLCSYSAVWSDETGDSDKENLPPLPELFRQDCIFLDDLDPHWSHYQSDRGIQTIIQNSPIQELVIPPGRYDFRPRKKINYKLTFN